MLALQVEVDSQLFAVAGAEDWGLLSLHVTANRGDPSAPAVSARIDYIDLSVGGMTESNEHGVTEHIRWGRHYLKVGSVVTLRIVDTNDVTPPIKRYRSDRQVQEQPFTPEEIRDMRRQSYLELKQEFEGGSEA
jgi:hypothetical protein